MQNENRWTPISRSDFEQIVDEQVYEMSNDSRRLLDPKRCDNLLAYILRSEESGLEPVFVVAKNERGVIYYDDVEDGFDFSPVDENGVVLRPGAGNNDLEELVLKYFNS